MNRAQHDTNLPAIQNFPGFAVSNSSALAALFGYCEKLIRTSAQLQSDYLDFLTMRINKDFELSRRLNECGDAADVFETNMDFTNTMIRDYADQNRKVMKMVMESAQDIEFEAETALAGEEPATKPSKNKS